ERDVERVMHPSPRLANHVALAERIAQCQEQALQWMVETIVGHAETHQPVPSDTGVNEPGDQQPEQAVHQHDEPNGNVPQDLAGNLFVHLRSIRTVRPASKSEKRKPEAKAPVTDSCS